MPTKSAPPAATSTGAGAALPSVVELIEVQNAKELDFVHNQKFLKMDDRPLAWICPITPPARSAAGAKVVYAVGLTNGHHKIELARKEERTDAFRVAGRVIGSMTPVSELNKDAGLVARIADTMLTLGRPASANDVASALMVSDYSDRDPEKFRGTIRAKVWNSDRYFKEDGKGQYTLRDEAKQIALAARAGATLKYSAVWTGTDLLEDQANAPKQARELSPQAAAIQTAERSGKAAAPAAGQATPGPDLFAWAAVTLPTAAPSTKTVVAASLTAAGAAQAEAQWLETPAQRQRLRLGIMQAAKDFGVTTSTLAVAVGQPVDAFCRGDQRRLSRDVVTALSKCMRVPEKKLLLEQESVEEMKAIAAFVAVPLTKGEVNPDRTNALRSLAVPHTRTRAPAQNTRTPAPPDSNEFASRAAVDDAAYQKFLKMDTRPCAFYCQEPAAKGQSGPAGNYSAGAFDDGGAIALRTTPRKDIAANTARMLQQIIEESRPSPTMHQRPVSAMPSISTIISGTPSPNMAATFQT